MHFSKKGFTIIELLVVITIISIMVVWVMNMRFDSSDTEKLNILDNEIITNLEQIRDFSLIWKWILNSWKLEIPDSRKTIISPSDWTISFWKIEKKYTINSTVSDYSEYIVQKPFKIDKIECRLLNNIVNEISATDSVTIKFEWQKISINSTDINCQDKVKEIIITTNILEKRKNKISINKLSGVIQKVKN